MKILSWNARGCNAPDKHRLIKRGLDQVKPDIVCLQETKLSREDAEISLGAGRFWEGVFSSAEGSSGPGGAWGDFDAILDSSDKIGARMGITTSQLGFQNFISDNGLREVKTNKGSYTWSNRRTDKQHIAEKLDRFFLGGNWASKPLLFEARVLPLAASDHFSIELLICLDCVLIRCPFKFEKMWLRDSSLKEFVASTWKEAHVRTGSEAFRFLKKLQHLKGKLKEWNKVKFRNIFNSRSRVEAELKDLECSILYHGMTLDAFNKEKMLKLRLNELLAREEVYWKQKSREGWLKEGDKNTKFFHNSV
ncbi:uncharacterized protein LOC131045996 [Cryptomeria japonica]|uniref:uncharacterized protein LOC131045996 n=1 Tax=Cryptomeria japonica TaxID=3369 RepID=UPI0027DA8EFA|nr:uncharacterized protein LOC131045996 [Cryptomeria japonica]